MSPVFGKPVFWMNKTQESVTFADLYQIICKTLSESGTVTFTANGTSMLPFIRGGRDRVTLTALDSDPEKGDVIFYRRKDGSFILHRVIAVKNGAYTFCGDHQFRRETGVERGDMIARMTGLERDGKTIDLQSFSHKAYLACLPLRRAFIRASFLLKRALKKAIHIFKRG